METSRKIPKSKVIDGLRFPPFNQPDKYKEGIQYEHQPNDLFLVTYPKCGTNWTRQILQLILNKGEIVESNPIIASDWVCLELAGADGLAKMRSPGIISTHLPSSRLQFSTQAKYVYITRNPKDCCVSAYHNIKSMGGCDFQDGTFDGFFEWFVGDDCYYGDYFDHLLPWYARRNEPNVLFFTYESMKADPRASVIKIANFVGESYGRMVKQNEEILEKILARSTANFMKNQMTESWKSLQEMPSEEIPEKMRNFLEEMKKNKHSSNTAGPGFDIVRKAEIGDWKNYFSAEQSARMNERIAEKTRGSDVMNLFKEYI